jgi:DNA-binding transcriptional LysR family regulator
MAAERETGELFMGLPGSGSGCSQSRAARPAQKEIHSDIIVFRNEQIMNRLINMACFAEVVEAGGFSAAAERLGHSRAVVSKRVAALERDFGITLLKRTTRRQSLTEAGEVLYAHCRRMLDEMNEAESRLSDFSSQPRGTLRVSAPYSWGTRVLGEPACAFLRRYPQIHMSLTLSDELADLAGSAVDVAIRLTAQPAPGLVARKLADVPTILCASPAYLAARGRPTHPRELATHACIYFAGEVVQNPWVFQGPDGTSSITVNGPLTVNSAEVLRQTALGGLGITCITRYQVEDLLHSGALVELLTQYRLPARAVYLVTLPDRLLPAKTRAFIDFLLQARAGQGTSGPPPRPPRREGRPSARRAPRPARR